MSTATYHRHRLEGCAPRPLASYLKALGVLRVVAEQADPGARAYWDQDTLVLVTRLDRVELEEFFLRAWTPSPCVSPWNKGSGLLAADPKGVDPVEASTAPRFEILRDGIQQAKALTNAMEHAVSTERAIKDETKKEKNAARRAALRADPEYKRRLAQAAKRCKSLKDSLQPECQRRWRGPAARWLRAAVVMGADGKAKFPALLGTGGNDGNLDFTNNALQRLGDLFDLSSAEGAPRPPAEGLLRGALFGEPTPELVKAGIGQFAPAASGGANTTSGPLGDSLLNPWDLPLLLEGAILFAAGTSRRLGAAGSESTTAPFSARSWAAGYGSADVSDESHQGEQWMPLWDRPWTLGELSALLAEGRCQLGRRPTESSVDVARAVARLGVARGVVAFERYGFIKRNGKSNYAVPLGHWPVRAEPNAELIDDLEAGEWWSRLRHTTGDKKAPASLQRLNRRLGDLVMEALGHGGEPARWQAVLICLAEVEAQLVVSGAFTAASRLAPLPRLSPAWVRAADDGGRELALALSLAGAGSSQSRRPVDPLRHHWLPLDEFGRFAKSERALRADPRVVAHGRDAETDLLRIVARRMIDAPTRTLPIVAHFHAPARVADLMALVRGEVDLSRTYTLARALSALDWANFGPQHRPDRRDERAPFDAIWAALRLCHPSAEDQRLRMDPAIVRLLASGDPARAFALVAQRLRGAGLQPPFQAVGLSATLGRRLATSLAFPISAHATQRIIDEFVPEPDAHRAQGA